MGRFFPGETVNINSVDEDNERSKLAPMAESCRGRNGGDIVYAAGPGPYGFKLAKLDAAIVDYLSRKNRN